MSKNTLVKGEQLREDSPRFDGFATMSDVTLVSKFLLLEHLRNISLT